MQASGAGMVIRSLGSVTWASVVPGSPGCLPGLGPERVREEPPRGAFARTVRGRRLGRGRGFLRQLQHQRMDLSGQLTDLHQQRIDALILCRLADVGSRQFAAQQRELSSEPLFGADGIGHRASLPTTQPDRRTSHTPLNSYTKKLRR